MSARRSTLAVLVLLSMAFAEAESKAQVGSGDATVGSLPPATKLANRRERGSRTAQQASTAKTPKKSPSLR